MNLKIGSRDSRLAIIQSEQIMEQLYTCYPQCRTELVTMKTTGDRILDRTLDKVGGKGLFVKELDQALLEGRVDATVHSLKDLPMDLSPRIPLVACSERADPRDVLVLPEGITVLNPDKPIGCASRRRRIQLQALFPDMEVAPVRGNIQTRLAKLDSGAYSALVLAAAGLHRLGLSHRIHRYFTVEEILPAAGQGILAVQCRPEEAELLGCLNHRESELCARAERSFVRTLGGGCSSPVAAYATLKEGCMTLTGLYVSPDERIVRKGSILGSGKNPENLGATLAINLREGVL